MKTDDPLLLKAIRDIKKVVRFVPNQTPHAKPWTGQLCEPGRVYRSLSEFWNITRIGNWTTLGK